MYTKYLNLTDSLKKDATLSSTPGQNSQLSIKLKATFLDRDTLTVFKQKFYPEVLSKKLTKGTLLESGLETGT